MLHTLYPSYVLSSFPAMSDAQNQELADIAWAVSRQNLALDAVHPADASAYHRLKSENMFEAYADNATVRHFAALVDGSVRDFLWQAYGYRCEHPIRHLAVALCQRDDVGTSGISVHTHAAPISVAYYPRFRIQTVPNAAVGQAGKNGEIDFYNPAALPRKPWPTPRRDHHHAALFRVRPTEGQMLVFEGHMPHGSAQFASGERVCLFISSTPEIPGKTKGLLLQEILHG